MGLYLLVMLLLGIGSYVSDALGPLFIDDLKYPEMPLYWRLLRGAVTVVLVAAWSFVMFAKRGRLALLVLESGLTIGLVLVYIHLGSTYFTVQPSLGPVFAPFGIVLLLVVRASLVPSPLSRTIVIGISSIVCLFVIASEPISALEPMVIDAVTFVAGAFVIATAATSHVIYGLRRQVPDAMRLGQYELGRKLGGAAWVWSTRRRTSCCAGRPR